ncbi:SRPBCC family protein [Pseudomonas extremaustralis]|uniref:SRPBCC family protein n=1 Tax=Pseudomonas extremaustralis TaxID=359110 RepID=UPI0021C81219|nr:SRPBCC family protein [Pseudomonas extremaustralis]MDB1112230.1 SRPBCC family protein [Pseudomonas extremaustralis]MDG2971016.1 SRPBCC family protein [Pseudomonas extremaustralis]UUJ41695.1 SRPBCC family protein [Pseudomonas extremaustralis]
MHVLDRIERKVLLSVSRKQVWEALVDAEQFGDWFGIALKDKTFVAGETIEAPITYPGYEHVIWKARIERILPQTLFSFRWHPYAVDKDVDYDQETPTLVEFTIEDRAPGILLRVVESGFNSLPTGRRQKAFKMNSRGWDEQMGNIESYLNRARQA